MRLLASKPDELCMLLVKCHFLSFKILTDWLLDVDRFDTVIFSAVVVDLTYSDIDRSTLLTRDDLLNWERKHGPIPQGSFVLLRTGWAKYYTQADKFLGHFSDDSRQVFPGKIETCKLDGKSSQEID